jgi:hypothetical protein
VTVQLKPIAAGPLPASLRVGASGGAAAAPSAGAGLPQIEIDNTSHNFADTHGGSPMVRSTSQVTVRAPLTGIAASISAGATDFTTSARLGCAGVGAVDPLNAGSYIMCTTGSTFAPTGAKGAKSGTLTVGGAGQSVTAALTGNALGPHADYARAARLRRRASGLDVSAGASR